jgi:hypothetical protein
MSQFILGDNVQTHNNSLANLIRGVGERVLFTNKALNTPVKPQPGVFVKRMGKIRERLVRYIGRQSRVSYDEFLTYYSGPRLKVYGRAVDTLRQKELCHKDAHVKTFVKAEKQNFTLKYDPAPRVIQPRGPRFTAELGTYLRPVEHKVYLAIDKLFQSPTIMSAYNSFTQAKILREKWANFSQPVCIGLDASRFDQHVSTQALQFEHEFYAKLFGHDPHLKQILKWQVKNYGRAIASDGYFTYKTDGSRMSGDINTSLGNKFIMCLMAYAYISTKSCKIEFVNNGDDCLMILERKDIPKLSDLKDYFKQLGFNIVTEDPVYIFEQIVFCQTSPVLSNNTWRMVRHIDTCMTKDITSVNFGDDVARYRELLFDVGNCGLATSADIPVMGSFYAMLKRFGVEGKEKAREHTYYYVSAKNAKCHYTKPDHIARYSFYLQTGILPDAQIELEKYFNSSVWGGDKRQLISAKTQSLLRCQNHEKPKVANPTHSLTKECQNAW